MSAVLYIHWTKCWGCQFGMHPTEAHTWMNGEDLEHAGMPYPETKADRRALSATHRCHCWCSRPVVRPKASADRTRPKGPRLGSRRHRRLVRAS